MRKRIGIAALALLLLAGCSSSPEQKMQRLQNDAEARKESSGFNACMKTFEEYDAAFAACVKGKLAAKGYTDGVTCTETPDDPVCKDTARYNAGVYANNDCLKETPDKRPDGYSCSDLLKDAQ